MPLCCLLPGTGMARPFISETAAGHQFSLSRQSCRCIVLMFLSQSERFFHCQRLPSSSSVTSSLQNAQVSCYPAVVGNITTVYSFYTGEYSLQLPTQTQVWWRGVAWLSPEVGIKFGIRLADCKWCCPLPWYGICVSKNHFNKEVQETIIGAATENN